MLGVSPNPLPLSQLVCPLGKRLDRESYQDLMSGNNQICVPS
ncbi:hypothetical protein MC7420_6213 [Coleofasciculus chthonoplastes PCC 7420]|uniref:Uncharacterized protein n=1 Tax=Coleofasciculus chthonoplastes PCC 7420 TaxID=118168 RepID=B4VTS5_9CYAN|nr:hypothetical protein MC7420_6213 [Coleofasciculus chthonoplastes PCC 7420]